MKIKDLMNLPIKINEEYKIGKDISDKDWSPDNQFLFSAKKKMTLREVIGGIFWEISFYGSPEDKEEQKGILDERVEEFNEAKETGDFSSYMTVGSPEWNDFITELTDRSKKNAESSKG